MKEPAGEGENDDNRVDVAKEEVIGYFFSIFFSKCKKEKADKKRDDNSNCEDD